jgi:hypothetical protein
VPLTPLILSAVLTIHAGDSLSQTRAYTLAFTLIAAHQATRDFLDIRSQVAVEEAIAIVDTVYTIDRFPFDSPLHGDVVSIYRAEVIRPLHARYAPWLAYGYARPGARGILFFSIIERGAFIAELFPMDPALRSYEQYSVALTGLKFLFSFGASGHIELRRHVRLDR